MAKPARPWIVTRHGPLVKVDDDLWTVEGAIPGIPGGQFPRTMSVVRLADGTVLLYNGIPLDDRGLSELAAIGRPSILVVPSPFHCIDAHAVRERFGLKVIAPAASAAAIAKTVPVDAHLDALPPGVEGISLRGTASGEAVLLVHGARGVTMLVCDVFLNVRHLPGFWGLVWRLAGFTGSAGPTLLWRRRIMTDRVALARHLETLAATPDLVRIVPSHGPIVDAAPADFLRGIAARL